MSSRGKNIIIVILCLVIVGSAGLTVHGVDSARRVAAGPNPNVTLVAAPDQTDFEEHPEWAAPAPEIIDYGENLAQGRKAQQNGQTQVYNCKNAVDGSRYTYWEGAADSWPGVITIDLEEAAELGGAQIMLSPNQIWGARTQEVEVQVSGDNQEFVTVVPRAALQFDPVENGNAVYLPFDAAVQGQYVRFCFYSNTGASAGQAAEIEIYGP